MSRPNPLSGDIWVRGVMEHPASKKPFKANALTYACFGFMAVYFAYQLPRIHYHCRKPDRVPSDALKYDRKTKKYVE